MRIKNIFGRQVNRSFAKYRVDWDRKVSGPQKMVKDIIRPYWIADDVYEELLIPNSILRVDLINFSKRVAIEVSPKSSHGYNEFFIKNRSNFLAFKKRELEKFRWFEINGIKGIELTDRDLKGVEWLGEVI